MKWIFIGPNILFIILYEPLRSYITSRWLDQPPVNIFLRLARQKEVWVEPEENRSGLGTSKESGENAWEGCLAYEMCIQNNHIRIPKKVCTFYIKLHTIGFCLNNHLSPSTLSSRQRAPSVSALTSFSLLPCSTDSKYIKMTLDVLALEG